MKSGFLAKKLCFILALTCLGPALGLAGVSRAIQERYRQAYENKAFFLKIPIVADKHYIFIGSGGARPSQAFVAGATRFKVGDQVRLVGMDFGGDEIKIKISAISGPGNAELIFKFDTNLLDNFPNSAAFDASLEDTFTEGLRYADLEESKRAYAEEQFERAVREIAATSGTTREAVLKHIAPRLPAYQDAARDLDNQRKRSQELSSQVSQAQSENRRLDGELRAQQSEVARLRTANTSLQERIDGMNSQLARVRDDLRNSQGETQGYQRELSNLQRSLKLRVDTNRDLGEQIAELGQAMQKLQRGNVELESQNSALKSGLEKQQAVNAKLSGEIDDLKASARKMKETIDTLTSKEDSLARQYIRLKQTKENLENIVLAVDALDIRQVEDRSERGERRGKAEVFLAEILIGSFNWRLPERLAANEARNAEASFAAESIDYVKVTAPARAILQSLGERLKVQLKMVSRSADLQIEPEQASAIQEIGERDTAVWRWQVVNRGAGADARLALDAGFLNKNSDLIPLFRQETAVQSSNIVRQVRGFLQPIPLAVGVLLGFLLFGVVGIFRRGKQARRPDRRARPDHTDTPSPSLRKGL